MALRYASPWKIGLYLLLSLAESLQVVFVAFIFQQFIDFAQKPRGSLLTLTGFAVLGLLIFGGIGIAYQYCKADIIATVNIRIKDISADYLVRSQHNDLGLDVSFMTNDLKQIETNRVTSELDIIFNAIQFLAAIISAFLGSVVLSLIFLVLSLVPGVLQNIFGPRIEKESSAWESENRKYTETVTDTVSGAAIARLYDTEFALISRLGQAARLMEQALKRTNCMKETASEVTKAVAYVCSMIIPFGVGIYFVTQGNITLGTFMMIAQLANTFINPVVSIFSQINDIRSSAPMWNKLTQVVSASRSFQLQRKLTKTDKADKGRKNTSLDGSQKEPAAFSSLALTDGGIQLGGKQILQHVNLTVTAGEKILLEAPSGWGKSTLLNVLIGNYALNQGSYTIDGVTMNGQWQAAHRFFSFIQQKPFIINDTILYNITLGRKLPEEKLLSIARQAGLLDLVQDKGWDYKVGINGCNLSGGQNQRIEIARALVEKRPILIADEATSALDPQLSQQIHETILTGFPGTVIEVAHKISDRERAMFTRVIELDKAEQA